MIKVKIHSSVDVITNSSTVIFTYQNSTQEVKELVAEIIKLSDTPDLTPDDLFFYGEFCESDTYAYAEGIVPDEYNGNSKLIETLIVAVLSGEQEKPDWMKEIEQDENHYEYMKPEIFLHILPKESKYEDLGKKLLNFLNSTDNESSYG